MIQNKLFAFILLFILSSFNVYAQFEKGVLPFKNFTTKDYNALPQNWCVDQDDRGVIYIGNNIGLLEYFGEDWKSHKVGNGTNVRSIDIGDNGYVYVGAINEFGYFGPDSLDKGQLTYYSFLDYLDTNTRNFQDVWYTACGKEGVYFGSDNDIFFWNGNSIEVIKSEKEIRKLFKHNGEVYVIFSDFKIALLKGNTLKEFQFKGKGIFNGISVFDDEWLLIITDGSKLNLLKIDGDRIITKPFKNSIEHLLKAYILECIVKVSDDRFAIGTVKGGVIVIDEKGSLIRIINKSTGILSSMVHDMFVDDQKNLWVVFDNGISRILMSSDYMAFPEKKTGYSGRVEAITEFCNVIYLASSDGLYAMDINIDEFPGKCKSQNIDKYSLSKFSSFEHKELKSSCWSLLPFYTENDSLLLVATNNAIVQIDKYKNADTVMSAYPWCIFQSRIDENRVFIGLEPGFISLYRENNTWILEEGFESISEMVRSIGEDDNGDLWLGTTQQGVIKISKPNFIDHKLVKGNIERFDYTNGLPQHDAIQVGLVNNEVVFASSEGLLRFDGVSKFFPDSTYGADLYNKDYTAHRVLQDKLGNVWFIKISNLDNKLEVNKFFSNNLKYDEYYSPYVIEDELLHSIYQDQEGYIWFGGTTGLFRYDESKTDTSNIPFNTKIDLILSGQDTIFWGMYTDQEGNVVTNQQDNQKRSFLFENNSFYFFFSALNFQSQVKIKYSWYLEGYDNPNQWSSWEQKVYKEYTNLDEGRYIFHVKAIDVFGNICNEASYEFVVNPPWYRTIWALFGFLLFFGTLVWIAVRISTRGLKRIIREATAEIQEQKDQLEEKNRNIIDSIRYAQRIQEAVIPSNSQFHQLFKSSFILWKPRDIVSGDFYWMMQRDNQFLVAAADCTGHGVPGAFMSIMGISFLNQISAMPEVKNAADVLDHLRSNVITSLNKEGSDTATKDGMDIALCSFNFEKMQVNYAGAYNPLYLIRDGKLLETKPDRMPIGVHDRDKNPFTNKVIDLQKGDQIYLFSDGYVDQFGGPKGKKMMSKFFKRFLLEIHHHPMEKQKELLWEHILKWRGDIEQVDDIIILGIRID